jgi:feruloyl esterase
MVQPEACHSSTCRIVMMLSSMPGAFSRLKRHSVDTGLLWLLALCCALGVAGTSHAHAQLPTADLPIVKPSGDCVALATTDLAKAAGAAVTAEASVIDTPKGQFCHVTGTIAPSIGFEVDLPVARWTQRFLQAGCGGLCGNINASIGNAGGCLPALDGQFVVAASDLGHKGAMGSPDEGAFAHDPQKRIDFAYRANHVTALVAKALIRTYYGQAPRYSYFSGCSDGGREALMEAERFPEDFDGISAGAPAMLFQVQNSFYHAWTTAANLRSDGSPILLSARLPVLHAAVVSHCDLLDGTKDGLLGDPRACMVDPAWVRCKAGTTDTSDCLTSEEWAAAARLYAGPSDAQGQRFLPGGLQPGSELQWAPFIPRDATTRPRNGMVTSMAPVVYRKPGADDAVPARFPFTTAQFARVNELHSLNDATNTDLDGFVRHGGKLVMWHGWSDSSIAPMISVAYHEAVRRRMGPAATDAFLRLFMLPGVGHCGGGDGFAQIDTLSPLMAWVEHGAAPARLIADKVPDRGMGPGGPPGRGGALSGPRGGPDDRNGPHPGGPMASAGGGPANGPDGRSGPPTGPRGFPGGPRQPAPYARAAQPALASRPILPFPALAVYDGDGEPTQTASYRLKSAVIPVKPTPTWFGASLIGPDFQLLYKVENGVLVAAGH